MESDTKEKKITRCASCKQPKAIEKCGLCLAELCKKCAQIVKEGRFSFLKIIPDFLSHRVYCAPCFNTKVAPEMEAYDQTMEKAKDIVVYLKPQGEETRLMKRSERPFTVVDCEDKEEALLRLAFFAAGAGFNAMVDVQLVPKKVRMPTGYQTTLWQGTGIPTNVNRRAGDKYDDSDD